MSHSTTTTSTYDLVKYSRSYPKNPNTATAHSQRGHPQAENPSEWQHFTNPIIRLVLDIRKKATSELESVRMRILWSMDFNGPSEQTDVVFEDLDLVSFSFLSPQSQPHDLPLKAVYRESIVGIRYLHPREVVATPIYRRFQITFTCPSAASQFIDSICSVCPCKANPTNNNPSRTFGNMNPPQHKTDIAMMGTAAPSVSRPTRTSAHLPSLSSQASQMPRGKPIAKTTPAPIPLVPPPQSDFMQFQSSPLISGGITSQAPSPPTLGPHSGIETSGVPLSAMSYNALTPARTYLSSAISHGILPPSSPPTLLLSSSTEDSQPPKAVEAAPAIAPAIVSPLQEPSNIYNLSQSSLECLIGDVVREDGFIKLLEQVSSMWRIRNLIPTDRRT